MSKDRTEIGKSHTVPHKQINQPQIFSTIIASQSCNSSENDEGTRLIKSSVMEQHCLNQESLIY